MRRESTNNLTDNVLSGVEREREREKMREREEEMKTFLNNSSRRVKINTA